MGLDTFLSYLRFLYCTMKSLHVLEKPHSSPSDVLSPRGAEKSTAAQALAVYGNMTLRRNNEVY